MPLLVAPCESHNPQFASPSPRQVLLPARGPERAAPQLRPGAHQLRAPGKTSTEMQHTQHSGKIAKGQKSQGSRVQ